jgi:uncharacterized protein (DUF2147 family)
MRILVAATATALVLMSSSAFAKEIKGVWLSADGGAKVRIADCGSAMCGSIVWLKKPIDQDTGQPRLDKHNPDANKRERPMLGLEVAHALKPRGEDKWSGTIYNADDGKTFDITLRVDSQTSATVEGCVLAVLCKNQHWTRVAY